MNASDIAFIVNREHANHKYNLCNTYIFHDWECDCFSITNSGYIYETEVKISRSDFFADFKKWKHKLLAAAFNKQKFFIRNMGQAIEYNTELFFVDYKKMVDNNRGIYKNSPYENTGIVYDYKTGKYITNQFQNFILKPVRNFIYPPKTNIKFYDLSTCKLPHKLIYAVPEGLVKKEEVPAYAGLYYIRGGYLKVEKPAPFIHKNKIDINSILLEKFYYLSIEQSAKIKRLEYELKSKE